MEEIYKLRINNTEYWDNTKNHNNFEKTKSPCHIYVKKEKPFINDKMICNYKDASGINYLWYPDKLGTRLREYNDYIIIEPSGIMVPKGQFELVKSKDEIKDNPGIDISTITRTTFFCSLLSDYNRCKEILAYDKVRDFRNGLLNQSLETINPSFLSPFEFAYLFAYVCYQHGIDEFDSNKLLTFIINKGKKPEYLPLLWNIEYSGGENYDTSDSLLFAFALLRYIGFIYPDYDKDDYYYEYKIDENISKYPQMILGKEAYLPLMEKFVDEHLGISKKDDKKKTKILDNLFKKNGK